MRQAQAQTSFHRTVVTKVSDLSVSRMMLLRWRWTLTIFYVLCNNENHHLKPVNVASFASRRTYKSRRNKANKFEAQLWSVDICSQRTWRARAAEISLAMDGNEDLPTLGSRRTFWKQTLVRLSPTEAGLLAYQHRLVTCLRNVFHSVREKAYATS